MCDPVSTGTAKLALDAAEKALKYTTIYEDGLQPFVKQGGKALETVGKTINMALSPISGLVWGYEKISEYIQTSLEEKFKSNKVPLENITTPDPLIAGSLINNFRFIGEKQSLRDMYINLLATSMNKETASTAHPCFVEIIKQLSSDEAKIMSLELHSQIQNKAIIKIQGLMDNGGFLDVYEHLSTIPYAANCEFPESFPTYLSNLTRLGLLSFTYESYFKHEDFYKVIKELSLTQAYINHILTDEWYINFGYKPHLQKGMIFITPLGSQFQKACLG